MAKEKKSSKELLKWKKKRWVQIVAPPIINNMVLGESLVAGPESLVGKTIESNLMVLTGDIKKQHMSVKFTIDSAKEGRAYVSLLSLKLSPSTIKRNVRRKKDRIDCVVSCKTKDEKDIVVKVILITKNNTTRSVISALGKRTVDYLTKAYASLSFEDAMIDAVDFRTQNEIKKDLKVIYPLRSFDIKFLGLKQQKKN